MKKSSFFKVEILIMLIIYQKDCYGYEIATTIAKESNGILELKEGAMYPVLHRLMDAGYITSYDEIVSKKSRVYYHIEEKGIEYLKFLIEDFRSKYQAIDNIIEKVGEIHRN